MQVAVLSLICSVCIVWIEAKVDTHDVPREMALCYGRFKKKTNIAKTPAAGIAAMCDNLYVWQHAKDLNIQRQATPEAKKYIHDLMFETMTEVKLHTLRRRKRQAGFVDPAAVTDTAAAAKKNLRVRKEIRMMSEKERNTLFKAINSAKKNTTIKPNKYDALAEFHTGITSVSAHGGCNFHGWHRMYLLMYENALREEGPEFSDIALPYWDSRLETRMNEDMIDTALFSDRLYGTCSGEAKGGLMGEGWDSDVGVIIRNCFTDGPLFTDEMIHNVTKQTRMIDICGEESMVEDDLEFHHNGGHRAIEGQMAMLQTAVYDPVFWIHHAFVDYIWEVFRENQKRNNVDRETDYPDNPTTMGAHDLHIRTAKMGFSDLDVIDGLSDMFTSEWYTYAPPPTCKPNKRDCGSKYIKCVVDQPTGSRPRARCVARTLAEVEKWEQEEQIKKQKEEQIKKQKSIKINKPIICENPLPVNETIPKPKLKPNPPQSDVGKPFQNTFCMNGKSDMGQWVYIPVKIIVRRPPEYKQYNSYPVVRGKLQKTGGDIYSPSAYSNVYRYLRNPEVAAMYEGCTESDVPTTEIYIKSVGLNYEGVYKDYALADRRLAVTVATAYLAVRRPISDTDVSVAMLHAQDKCGRVCKPICKVPGTQIFRPCSGAVQLTGTLPLQFGNSFGDAVLDVWDFSQESACPQLTTNNIIVSFYCDYKTEWIWPTIDPPPRVIAPVTPPVPIHQMTTISAGCKLDVGCFINQPCKDLENCQHGTVLHCLKSCHKYAVCFQGQYYIMTCDRGQKFDPNRPKVLGGPGCVKGFCDYRSSGLGRWNRGRNNPNSAAARRIQFNPGAGGNTNIRGLGRIRNPGRGRNKNRTPMRG